MAIRAIESAADATEAAVVLQRLGREHVGIVWQRDIAGLVFRDPVTGLLVNLPIGTSIAGGTVNASGPVVVGSAKQIDTIAVDTPVIGTTATPGAATQVVSKVIKKAIPDAAATAFLTVTVPNGNHAAAIRVTLLASIAAVADQFESSRVATGTVVLARVTGANVVAAVSAIAQAQIATVAGGETITLAYSVSAITGAVGAVNTFGVEVTITRAGGTGTHQVVALVELINAEASGVTMAAA